MSTDLLPCPFCPGVVRQNTNHADWMAHEGEQHGCVLGYFTGPKAKWNTRPATPAPESPAPARTDLDWDLINRVSKAPAQSFMAPEVGTGSETSPDASASPDALPVDILDIDSAITKAYRAWDQSRNPCYLPTEVKLALKDAGYTIVRVQP